MSNKTAHAVEPAANTGYPLCSSSIVCKDGVPTNGPGAYTAHVDGHHDLWTIDADETTNCSLALVVEALFSQSQESCTPVFSSTLTLPRHPHQPGCEVPEPGRWSWTCLRAMCHDAVKQDGNQD